MPLPSLLPLTIALGIAAALAGQAELRLSPRPPLLTASYLACLSLLLLVVIPVSVYFYVFHGDWFLLYAVDSGEIPSAVALLGFLAQIGLGTVGFVGGAIAVRGQHRVLAYIALGLCVGAAAVVPAAVGDRLGRVGTFAQFHGDFGLSAFGDTPLLTGTLVMSGVLAAGTVWLLATLRRTHK